MGVLMGVNAGRTGVPMVPLIVSRKLLGVEHMKGESWLPTFWGERKGDVDPFRALKTQMDELFSDWSGNVERMTGANGLRSLRIDVSETPTELTVKADLPGVEQKDIDVTVSGDKLTIKAEKKSEAEEKKDENGRIYHRVERSCGSFLRSLSLPFNVDTGKVSANFKDGVLTLNIPKPPEVQKQTKRIEIKHAA
jgi:HSP20 family protein